MILNLLCFLCFGDIAPPVGDLFPQILGGDQSVAFHFIEQGFAIDAQRLSYFLPVPLELIQHGKDEQLLILGQHGIEILGGHATAVGKGHLIRRSLGFGGCAGKIDLLLVAIAYDHILQLTHVSGPIVVIELFH